LYRFYNPFTFADGTGHGFFAPDIFPGSSCLGGDQGVPVGRSSNVYNVYFRQLDYFPVIVEGFNPAFQHLLSLLQMATVYIANSHYTGASVGEMIPAHLSCTYHCFGQLIAGSQVTPAQHMPWHDGKGGDCPHCIPDKCTPGMILFLLHGEYEKYKI
jgi:hypothetical protein